jgi:hypothetical protein
MTVISESRQEERKDGGQISGVRSECRVRPSLDQGEPARSLKCKKRRNAKCQIMWSNSILEFHRSGLEGVENLHGEVEKSRSDEIAKLDKIMKRLNHEVAKSREDLDCQFTRTWTVDMSSISEFFLSRLGVTRTSI